MIRKHFAEDTATIRIDYYHYYFKIPTSTCSGLNGGLEQGVSTSSSHEPVCVTLFGKGCFADVIKVWILIGGEHPGLPGWTFNTGTSILLGDVQRRHAQRGGADTETDIELAAGWTRVQEGWLPPEAGPFLRPLKVMSLLTP